MRNDWKKMLHVVKIYHVVNPRFTSAVFKGQYQSISQVLFHNRFLQSPWNRSQTCLVTFLKWLPLCSCTFQSFEWNKGKNNFIETCTDKGAFNRSVMADWLESAPFNTRVPSLNPVRAALQKSNMFKNNHVAEAHEPSIGIVCESLISPKSEPALEPHSSAAPSLKAHHHVNGPDTGRNSGGRWIKKIKRGIQKGLHANLTQNWPPPPLSRLNGYLT